MKRNLSVAALVGAMLMPLLFVVGATGASPEKEATDRPELAYLKQVNAWHPPSDPQLLLSADAAVRQRGSTPRGRGLSR